MIEPRCVRQYCRVVVFLVLVLTAVARADQFETVELGEIGDGIGLSMAVGNGNRPALSYFNSNSGRLYLREHTGSGWNVSQVGGTYPGSISSALVLVDTAPHIFFANGGHLFHAFRVGGSWALETIDSSGRVGARVGAALCRFGLCVSYADATAGDLVFIRGVTGVWVREVVDASAAIVGSHSAIAADAQGRPAVAYSDDTSGALKVAARTDAGSWNIESVAYAGRRIGPYPAIAVSSDGTIHVTTSRSKSNPTLAESGLYYARRQSAWEIAEISRDYLGGPTAFHFDSAGAPQVFARYLRFHETYGNAVGFRRLELISGLWRSSPASWMQESASSVRPVEGLSVARNPWGDVYVAYGIGQASGLPNVAGLRLERPTDTDGDLIPNAQEGLYGTDAARADTDGDGIPDGEEVLLRSSNPLVPDGPPVTTTTLVTTTTTLLLPPVPPRPVRDSDGDGVPDSRDNCPVVRNRNQRDRDRDGIGDACDRSRLERVLPPAGPDADLDGISDGRELELGLDSQSADTDRDGMEDGQEVADNTDPVDPGSRSRALPASFCAWGITSPAASPTFELLNSTSAARSAELSLRRDSAGPVSAAECNMNGEGRCTASVESSGGGGDQLCIEHEGNGGDVDAVAIGLLPGQKGPLALSYPLGEALLGDQFLLYSAVNPSRLRSAKKNRVVNQIRVANGGTESGEGDLRILKASGSAVWERHLVLRPGESYSVEVRSGSGMIEWRPSTAAVPFEVTNVRLFHDNPTSRQSFLAAVAGRGDYGSGQQLVAPVDLREGESVAEIANVSDAPQTVTLTVYDATGALLEQKRVTFSSKEMKRLAVGAMLGKNRRGSLKLSGGSRGSILAAVIHSSLTKKGGVRSVVIFPAMSAVGSSIRGSFSADSSSRLIVLNATDTDQPATVLFRRNDASEAGRRPLNLPRRASLEMKIESVTGGNLSGAAAVEAAETNALVGWMVRYGRNGGATVLPVRE